MNDTYHNPLHHICQILSFPLKMQKMPLSISTTSESLEIASCQWDKLNWRASSAHTVCWDYWSENVGKCREISFDWVWFRTLVLAVAFRVFLSSESYRHANTGLRSEKYTQKLMKYENANICIVRSRNSERNAQRAHTTITELFRFFFCN